MKIGEKTPSKVLLDLHYLPSLEYFCCVLPFEELLIESCENYQKQSYRNRCKIMSANRKLDLSVPVRKDAKNIPIRKINIDYNQPWLNTHWRSIISAYGKAPFAEYFLRDFETVFFSKPAFLFDLNFQLLTLCLKLLGWSKDIRLTEVYLKNYGSEVLDCRGDIIPKVTFRERAFYKVYPYNQIFGKEFVPNLSVIDLLFCEGPNADYILRKSNRLQDFG